MVENFVFSTCTVAPAKGSPVFESNTLPLIFWENETIVIPDKIKVNAILKNSLGSFGNIKS
jgi:hypothetical protein